MYAVEGVLFGVGDTEIVIFLGPLKTRDAHLQVGDGVCVLVGDVEPVEAEVAFC